MTAKRMAFVGNWTTSTLPNASGSQTVDAALKVGDFAYDTTLGMIVVCKDATIGSAVWTPASRREIVLGVAGALPANATRYFTPGGLMTVEVGWRFESPCVVRVLHIRAGTAPGGAVTDSYQVKKNGSGSSLQADLTGANTNVTKSDAPLSFAAGDVCALRLITGVGTVSADVIATLTVDGP